MKYTPLILDLKVTKNGPKILEFQQWCNFDGYNKIKDGLLTIENTQFAMGVKNVPGRIGEFPFMDQLCDDKSVCALLARGGEFNTILPRQAIVRSRTALCDIDSEAERVRRLVGNPEHYVIKPAEGSDGRGVAIVDNEGLEFFVRQCLPENRDVAKSLGPDFEYYRVNPDSFIIIQEYEESLPVDREGKIYSAGVLPDKYYDPTLRMVLILGLDEDNLEIKLADSYWKYPLRANNGEFSLDARLSKVSSRVEDRESFASRLLARQDQTGILDAMLPQLQEFLELALLSSKGMFLKRLISSNEKSEFLSGLYIMNSTAREMFEGLGPNARKHLCREVSRRADGFGVKETDDNVAKSLLELFGCLVQRHGLVLA